MVKRKNLFRKRFIAAIMALSLAVTPVSSVYAEDTVSADGETVTQDVTEMQTTENVTEAPAQTETTVSTKTIPETTATELPTEATTEAPKLNALMGSTGNVSVVVSNRDGSSFAQGSLVQVQTLDEVCASAEDPSAAYNNLVSVLQEAWRNTLANDYINAHPGTWTVKEADVVTKTALSSVKTFIPLYVNVLDENGNVVNGRDMDFQVHIGSSDFYNDCSSGNYLYVGYHFEKNYQLSDTLGIVSVANYVDSSSTEISFTSSGSGWYSVLLRNAGWTADLSSGQEKQEESKADNTPVQEENTAPDNPETSISETSESSTIINMNPDSVSQETSTQETQPDTTVINMNPDSTTQDSTEDSVQVDKTDETNSVQETETDNAVDDANPDQTDVIGKDVESEVENVLPEETTDIPASDVPSETVINMNPQETDEQKTTDALQDNVLEVPLVGMGADNESSEQDQSESEADATLDLNLSDTESVSETESEQGDLMVSEVVNEDASELAAMPEELAPAYHVYTSGDNATYGVVVESANGYDTGDLVKIEVTPYTYEEVPYEISAININEVTYNEVVDEEDDFTLGSFFTYGSAVEYNVPDMGEDGTIYVEFVMPDSDVYIDVTAIVQGSGIMLLDVDLEDSLPAGGYYDAETGSWIAYPAKFADSDYGTSAKKINVFKDGKKVATVDGYCIQASFGSPESGSVSNSYKLTNTNTDAEEELAKALFYLYGGPGWKFTFQGADGKGYNFSKIFQTDNELSDNESFAMSHIILSKLYWNFCDATNRSTNWSWNAGWTKGSSGTKKTNVLTSAGKTFVNDVIAAIEQLDYPECKLSETTFAESSITMNSATGRYRTPSIVYTTIKENTLSIALSGGLVVVNETTGTETASGTAVVNGGDTFHFEMSNQNRTTGSASYTGKTGLFGAFRSWRYRNTAGANGAYSQAVGFSYASSEDAFTFNIEWPEAFASIKIVKKDKATGSTTPMPGYNLQGTVYGVYSDAACTSLIEQLTIGADGTATTSNPYNIGTTYYVKEISANSEYELDNNIYQVTIAGDDVATPHVVNCEDVPKSVQIKVEKHDSVTGTTSSSISGQSLYGAQYGVYAEETCKTLLETLTIGTDGIAVSAGSYYIGTYYVKETQAPTCGLYSMDTNVYTVSVTKDSVVSKTIPVVVSVDTPMQGKISIQKTDAETGKTEPIASNFSFEGIEFAVYSDADCTTKVATLYTDVNGYAELGDLSIQDYYVREITAPEGYLLNTNVFKVAADDMKEQVRNGSASVAVTVPNQVIRANVALSKIADSQDSSNIPTNANLQGITFRFTYVEDPSVTFTVVNGAVDLGNGSSQENNVIVTDRDGYCTTESSLYPAGTLIYGDWYIEEFNEPEGFAPIEKTTIRIEENGRLYRYVVNNENYQVRLLIEKRDSNTNALIPVSGVAFKIEKSDGTYVELFDFVKREYTDTWVTDYDGSIYLPGTLMIGKYKLIEVSGIPAGYKSIEPLVFEIGEDYSDPTKPFVLTCLEPNQMGQITVTKKDAETGETLGEGFTFDITVKEDIIDLAGNIRTGQDVNGETVSLIKGTVVDRITTGTNGVAVSKELFLGAYSVTETAVGNGYAISEDEKEAVLAADAEAEIAKAEVEFANYPTTLKLFKKDSIKGQPLSGITFRIKPDTAEDDNSQLYVTDANGEILIKGLQKDTAYKIQEVETLPGYHLDTTPYWFAVDKDGLIDGSYLFEFGLTNVPNVLHVAKVDNNGLTLPGASLVLKNEAGEVIEKWTSADTAHEILGLPAGRYYLYEETAPDGYVPTNPLTFELKDSLKIQLLKVVDDHTKVEITKSDMVTGGPVIGAVLYILDAEGKEIERWETTSQPHMIEKLPAGTYTLVEETAPDGYVTAESVEFTVELTGEIQQVEMQDDHTKVQISKTDITTGEPVIGAELIITDEDGKEIKHWRTTNEPAMFDMLPVGRYVLTEITAPEGYVKAENISFEVLDSGEIQKVEMKDDYTKVSITKSDITDGKPVIDAVLVITDPEGNEIDRWITTEEPHIIERFPAGEYTLTEITAPAGYAVAESVTFTVQETGAIQKVDMKDAHIGVEITKTDITDGKPLKDAELIVKDSEGKEIDRWITTEEPHYIDFLPAGKYTLTEIAAPAGYVTAKTIEFEVTNSGEIQKVEMKDDVTKVEISKTDITTGKLLKDAELVIKDKDGNELYHWITTEEPYYIEKLPVGEYTLTEIIAPAGYKVAETVMFTVEDTGEIQKVEMKDEPLAEGETPTPSTPTSTVENVAPAKTGLTENTMVVLFAALVVACIVVGTYTYRKSKRGK